MLFQTRRLFAAALIVSVFFLMHIAQIGYAGGRPKIAFSSTRDGDSEIYVMDSDGRNQVRLTDDPAWDHEPSWSPDGKKIAFVSNRNNKANHIYVMDSNGQNLMRLTNEAASREPAWSPNGEKIAYVKGGRRIWLMDADGSNQQQLTQFGKNRQPAWSPDGKRIAFVKGNGVYVMDENGSNQERLTPNIEHTHNPSWSPDGSWIAFGAVDKEHWFQIYVAAPDGVPRLERLTGNLPHKLGAGWKIEPAWSPDGETIAYTSWIIRFRVSRETIHLMTVEGEHLKQLSEEHDGSDKDPDWYAPIGWSVSPAMNFATIWGEIKTSTANRR